MVIVGYELSLTFNDSAAKTEDGNNQYNNNNHHTKTVRLIICNYCYAPSDNDE